MLSILIFNSDKAVADMLFRNTVNLLKRIRIRCEVSYISEYEKAAGQLAQNINRYDILVLDGSDDNGINVAKLVRKQNYYAALVFITAPDMIKSIIGYRPSALIYDRESAEELDAAVLSACREQHGKRNYFVVKSRDSVLKFVYSDIVYFESDKRIVTLYTRKQGVDFYAKLSDILDLLPPGEFVRCHQSYIVNMSMIQSLDKANRCFCIDNGQTIEISKKNYQAVVKVYEEYLGLRGAGKTENDN